jgi:hypothetical protein
VTQLLTFVDRPKRSEEEGGGGGVIQGKGGGITMAGQQSEDVATFTGEAVGRISSF